MLKNDFIVKVNKTNLVLKADASTLQDIAAVLDHLVNMVHLLKNKAEITENRQARQARVHQYHVNEANRDKATEIFSRYLVHLNNGCSGNKTKAAQEIASEYKLQIIDARFYISLGRKTAKEEERKKQCKLF